jgi:hypothetical protein
MAHLLMAEAEWTARTEKAFSFAQDTTKQVITLSTAIFTLTLTFLKDVAPRGTSTTLLQFGWGCYIGSVVLGVATLMALTGNIERPQSPDAHSIYSRNITFLYGCQVLLFFAGLGLTFAFGVKAA